MPLLDKFINKWYNLHIIILKGFLYMRKRILSVLLLLAMVLTSCGSDSIVKYKVEFYVDGELVHTGSSKSDAMLQIPDDPTKDGYIFDGWYADPRTKVEKISKVTLTENIVVYAKWIDDGSVKQNDNIVIKRTVTDSSVILETTSGTVEAPVTQLWIQQNARLEALMKLKNEHFNK